MDSLGPDWTLTTHGNVLYNREWGPYNDRIFLMRDEPGLWRVMNHGECVATLPMSEAIVLVRALEVLDVYNNT